MKEVSPDELRHAVEHNFGCRATYVESVPVEERFQGKVVWSGEVAVFDLAGHTTTTRAYAWSHSVGTGARRRFVTVLHQGPIDSPLMAVRAAVVSEIRRARPKPEGSE